MTERSQVQLPQAPNFFQVNIIRSTSAHSENYWRIQISWATFTITSLNTVRIIVGQTPLKHDKALMANQPFM